MASYSEESLGMAIIDQLIRSLTDESCQDPSITELRKAMEAHSPDQASDTVNILLAQIPTPGTPITFDQLMNRMASRAVQPQESPTSSDDITDIISSLQNTSLNGPNPTNGFAAAFGLNIQENSILTFDDPLSPYYDIDLDLPGAAKYILEVFSQATKEVAWWQEMVTSEDYDFHNFVRQIEEVPVGHPITWMEGTMEQLWMFLENGRKGWKLVELEVEFYDEVIPMICCLVQRVTELESVVPECEVFREIIDMLGKIGERLVWLKAMRMQIEENRRQHLEKMEMARKALETGLEAIGENMTSISLGEKAAGNMTNGHGKEWAVEAGQVVSKEQGDLDMDI